jgi:hypothetical protein
LDETLSESNEILCRAKDEIKTTKALSKTRCDDIVMLIESLLNHLDNESCRLDKGKCSNAFKCLDTLFGFQCLKQLLQLDSSIVDRLLKVFKHVDYPKELLLPKASILLNISEYKWFGKLNFTPDDASLACLDEEDREKFKENLGQKSIQEILEIFQQQGTNFSSAQNKNSIRHLSVILNHVKDDGDFFYWHLFSQPSLFKLFTSWLDYLIKRTVI